MNYKLIAKILGHILVVEAATMLFPTAVALIYGESPMHFIITIGIALVIGLPLARSAYKGKKSMRVRDGLAAVAIAWIALSFFGCLPFIISGEIPNLHDAFFETVSGFTTTGASILSDVEALSKGSLFWRSFTHWLGGMGVLVFALAILPNIGGSTQLMRAESPGPISEKLVPRAGYSAKILYKIYIVMTMVCILAMVLAGMPLFDSMCHGFGTAGTGGFSIYNNGYAHYNSLPIEIVTTVFMLLFSVNFTVYFKMLTGHIKTALKNEEVWFFGGITLVAMVIVSLGAVSFYGGDVGNAFRQGTFHVASIISTTGFSATNYDLWPQISRVVLMFVMITGACAGSTAGGLKSSRILIMLKRIRCEINHLLHPRSVRGIKMDGKAVEPEVVSSVMLYISIYFVIIIISTVIISLDNISFDGTLSAVLTTVNNVGPGFAEVGPAANFGGLSILSKVTLSICMLLGRLEILPIVLIFTPAAWRKSS